MATELGQAYVQIMPSAKGISGSIQKQLDPEAIAAGKSAGSNIASSIANSLGDIGGNLTKKITLPAVAAATAVGGIVAAFGWKRLTGMDEAQAQLKGLGYEVADVERISKQVNAAVQGTTMTMAEGTSVAAGALAAGVKEGADLERYIRQVGNAAVGANRPIGDMAQIFNRVQGSGKLMTQELNMIEQGMPGFAMAMADSLGVPQAEFRKMVTAGQVSSEQFLDVMEGFAGDMSEAYSNSWAGMVSNTKAWIGIIGESILSGVFEQSKESIAEFMEYLKTDDVQQWAAEAGAAIGDAFTKVVESVKSAIEWWAGLSDTTKTVIKTLALLVVAIGPVLTIVSKVISIVTTASKVFGTLKTAASVLGVAIGAITAPVAIAIAAITAIIAVGVLLYKNWDTIKEKASQLGQWLSQTWQNIRQAVSNSVNAIKQSVYDGMAAAFNTVTGFFSRFRDAGRNIVTSIADGIRSAIGTVTNAISNVTQKVRDFLPFSPAKEGPLKDLHKLDFSVIADGIHNAKKPVASAMQDLAQSTMDSYDAITGMKSGISYRATRSIVKDGDGETGGVIITGNTFNVRNDNDILRIAKELHHLQQAQSRGKGLVFA